ncbi:glycosyltransferase family 4 protein [uncultured Acetobacteroides sp.]|uniref:glycosyltransferase family 4 protein n=1 Tax=uncultured Acetobacteroides sp. TaxID=1760811 RepID=UPI0029F4F236|nr:glycosyltransferase family 4 protein [uncultured Acetobacteroides sp.]
MNILVSNRNLGKTGGSETFTYTLIGELVKRGHSVEYFCFKRGLVASKIEEDFGVGFMSKPKYDLIFANHLKTVEFLYRFGPVIQTCHGIFPHSERPSLHADGYISISQEVQELLLKSGILSPIIHNGIDCERFRPMKPLRNSNIRVLSLCQSEEGHQQVLDACKLVGAEFGKLDKKIDNIWDVSSAINEYDLVVGLGRSAYEALACGRPVVIYDKRPYASSMGDGYFLDVMPMSLKNNCSGRALHRDFSIEDLAHEIGRYRPEDGNIARRYAEQSFNVERAVDAYLEYAKSLRSINLMHKIAMQERGLLPNFIVRFLQNRIRKGVIAAYS